MLKVIETRHAATSQEIMDLDQALLGSPDTILHLYTWPCPTASYGCLVKPEEFLDKEAAEKTGLALAKRPTGGGIIFHLTDLAFSFLMPSSSPHFSLNTEDNYLFVNQLVINALRENAPLPYSFLTEESGRSRFCMAKATKFDVMLEGGKLVGAAQRRTKAGLLHQGSISLAPPPFDLLKNFLKKSVYEEMHQTSRYLFPDGLSLENLIQKRAQLEHSLITAFTPPP